MAAARPRLPGRVRESRPRPQRLPHRRADRHRLGGSSSAARARRHSVRSARLQAAVRLDDPAGADRDRALAHGIRRRARPSRCSSLAATLAFGIETWRAFFAFAEYTRSDRARDRARPAGTRSRACSPGRACGAAASRSPTRCRARSTLAVAAALIWLWRAPAAFALKAAALCLAAILATPYSLDYDLMVLAPAIAFLAVDGIDARLRPVGEDHARVLSGSCR